MHPLARLSFLALALVAGSSASARDLYISRVAVATIPPDAVVASANSLTDFEQLYDEASLMELFPGYIADFTPVVANVDFRGVDVTLRYALNDTALSFSVEGTSIAVVFDGVPEGGGPPSRDEAQQQFEDWLAGQQTGVGSTVTELLQALVAESPVDPVAGNPNSLQTRMFESDFDLGSFGPFLRDFDEGERIPLLFKADPEFIGFGAGPYSGQSYGLALDVGIPLHRRLSLVSDLDVLLSVIGGDAFAANGGLGLGLQGRILDWWNLAIIGRVGLVGSIDVGAVALMGSVSLVNHMRFDLDEWRIDLRNAVGVASTGSGFELEGIDLDYDLTNVSFKTGLELSRAFRVPRTSRSVRTRAFWTNSVYVGDELWAEHTNELGLGFGLVDPTGSRAFDPISLDVSWLAAAGRNYDALRVQVSLRY